MIVCIDSFLYLLIVFCCVTMLFVCLVILYECGCMCVGRLVSFRAYFNSVWFFCVDRCPVPKAATPSPGGGIFTLSGFVCSVMGATMLFLSFGFGLQW